MIELLNEMGVNAAREHQILIGLLNTQLTNLYLSKKTDLLPIPEAMINETETSPTPDIMLINSDNQTVAVIEITNTAGVKKDVKKILELFEDYEVQEGFVYDYKLKKWRKFKNGVGEIPQNTSFCESINCDLNDLLNI